MNITDPPFRSLSQSNTIETMKEMRGGGKEGGITKFRYGIEFGEIKKLCIK